MSINMRPGIYISYTTYPLRGNASLRPVGLALPSETADLSLLTVTSADEAAALPNGAGAVAIAAMTAGGCDVNVALYPPGDGSGFKDALARLAESGAYCLVCTEGELAASCGREAVPDRRLLFAGVPAQWAGKEGDCASGINGERVILTAPSLLYGGYDVAPAVTAALASNTAGSNLCFAELPPEYTLSENYTEEKKNALLRQGVTVLEQGPVSPRIIRCVTTRTADGTGKPSASFRNLSTITALDEAVQSLYDALERRFQAGSGRMSLDAVRSLTECELLAMEERGILSGYLPPTVEPDPEDPCGCLVTVGMQIAQNVVQVTVQASIGV